MEKDCGTKKIVYYSQSINYSKLTTFTMLYQQTCGQIAGLMSYHQQSK